jgi:hypothetical protein
MPIPSSQQVYINEVLSNFAINYLGEAKGRFVADRAFTHVPVAKRSAIYPVWSKADLLRIQAQPRADGGESAIGGQRLNLTNTYNCERYALKVAINDPERENALSQINLEQAKTAFLMRQLLAKRDMVWASAAFVTGVWTGATEQTGVSSSPSSNQFLQWNDPSSTPIDDVSEQLDAVQLANGGFRPNKMVIPNNVLTVLSNHATVLDRIKYTEKGIVTTDLLASLWGLDEVIVGQAVYNSAAEGQSPSMVRMMGKNCLLLNTSPASSDLQSTPTAGASFSWTPFDSPGADNESTEPSVRIKQWREEPKESDMYESEIAFVPKIVAPDLGVMMLSCIA